MSSPFTPSPRRWPIRWMIAGLVALLAFLVYLLSITGIYPLTDQDRFNKKFNTLMGQLQEESQPGRSEALLDDLIERYYTLRKDKAFVETDHGYRFKDLYFTREPLFRALLNRWIERGVYDNADDLAKDVAAFEKAFPQSTALAGFKDQLKKTKAGLARSYEKKRAAEVQAVTDFPAFQKKLAEFEQEFGADSAYLPQLRDRLEQLNIEYLKARHD